MESKSTRKARQKLTQLCEVGAPSRRIRRAVERLQRRIRVTEGRHLAQALAEVEAVTEANRERD